MIDFSEIEKKNWLYELLYPYVRFAHDKVYYRRLYVAGKENLPSVGTPYMMLSNHQNGLNDAMLMLTSQDDASRRPVFIARADIYNKKLVGLLMRFLRILPAFRVRDTGREHVGDNTAIFARAADILAHGGVIGMFPEALAHRESELKPLKKGFARIAFSAAESKEGIVLMPVANWYGDYEHTGGVAGIWYGEGIQYDDLMPLYREQPAKAYSELCERMHEAISNVQKQRDEWVEAHGAEFSKPRRFSALLWIPRLIGLLVNLIPIGVIEAIVALVVKNPILRGSTRMALGIFILAPVLWLVIAVIVGCLAGWPWGVAMLIVQPIGMAAWCL